MFYDVSNYITLFSNAKGKCIKFQVHLEFSSHEDKVY